MDNDRPLFFTTDELLAAAEVITKGGVVAYPTETFYGLAADPFNPQAVEKVYKLKGRDFKNPLSVIIASALELDRFASGVTAKARGLMERHWPGPLTIVFKAKAAVPDILTAGSGTIAVRVPGSPVARELARLAGPITSTSANPSGKESPVSARRVVEYFGNRLDGVIEGGRLEGTLGSTIIDLTGDGMRVIREGEIDLADL